MKKYALKYEQQNKEKKYETVTPHFENSPKHSENLLKLKVIGIQRKK